MPGPRTGLQRGSDLVPQFVKRKFYHGDPGGFGLMHHSHKFSPGHVAREKEVLDGSVQLLEIDQEHQCLNLVLLALPRTEDLLLVMQHAFVRSIRRVKLALFKHLGQNGVRHDPLLLQDAERIPRRVL